MLPSNLNANRAIVTAAVLYVFRCLIDEDIPLNGGVLRTGRNCSAGMPAQSPGARRSRSSAQQWSAAMSRRRSGSSTCLLGALEVAAASQGTMNNLTFGDATFGYYETICGGSGSHARCRRQLTRVHTHMTNTRLTDVEVIERRYPVRVHRDSQSVADRAEPADTAEATESCGESNSCGRSKVSMLSERRGPYPPFGLQGGHPGALGKNSIRRAASNEDAPLGGKFAIEVNPGDVLTIETPGGGAYG